MPCIRTCKVGPEDVLEKMRKIWEKWDLRILVLYILFTQLYLHVFGRRRRKSTTQMMNKANVWVLYLFADLLATIALGKLSKVKGDNDDIKPMSLLRGLWAPLILFYLGGPDTMTVLRLEENQIWLRHAIGLFTQGLRTSYVLIVTWNSLYGFSLLALLMLFPGLIKYGERVWVIKSIAEKKYVGFVQIDEFTIDKINTKKPKAKPVLQAYSYFQTLMPHISNYECDRTKVRKLVNECHERMSEKDAAHSTFKLIEIELGLMYDMHFSKVGTIFTVWGSILRFICVSCIVTVLVGFFLVKKPTGYWKGDIPITIILLVGALFLEIVGVLVQLSSDWAIVWACKQYSSKLVTPVFLLHELVISKNKRWSELMGQFSLLNFSIKYKQTKFKQMMVNLCGMENTWKKFSLPLSPVHLRVKELIINLLRETSQKVLEVETSQAITLKRGEWTLGRYGYLDANWSIELEFGESVVIWHVVTDVLYHSESMALDEVEATKILSYYMMHLLLICPTLPFCNNNEKFMQAYRDVKKYFEERRSISSDQKPYKFLLEKESNSDNQTINKIQKLACGLIEKENKWDIMSNVWVEMLCYAASRCSVNHHVQELRRGGQFLTHVWLLLMHVGVTKKLEKIASQELKEELESGLKSGTDTVLNLEEVANFGETSSCVAQCSF